MYMEKPAPIKGLKIKYDGKTYENIIHLTIDNWEDENNNVLFTNADNENLTTNIKCSLKDIKIIIEK